jgi:hypothetical protein
MRINQSQLRPAINSSKFDDPVLFIARMTGTWIMPYEAARSGPPVEPIQLQIFSPPPQLRGAGPLSASSSTRDSRGSLNKFVSVVSG